METRQVLILGALAALAAPAAAPAQEIAMFGNTPSRNMVSDETGVVGDWDVDTGRNVLWSQPVGSQAYGGPVVANNRVYVGTNNEGLRDPSIEGDRGVVMAFAADTGTFLWQMVHPKLPAGRVNDWPRQGVCSTAYMEGDRIYYVSNEAHIVCLDANGFANGNDGPFTDEEDTGEIAGDIIWSYDMIGELDVFPHNLATGSPLIIGDVLYTVTSNGVDEGHVNVPSPFSPDFIALDKNTGELLWESTPVGENILHAAETPAEIAEALGAEAGAADAADVEERLEQARRVLFQKRETRERPLLDDKILTDWNGLMIAALARSGLAFGDESLVEAAARAADFILERLRDGEGRLLHRYRDGDAAIPAGAADHACLCWGLIELYGATFDPRWLRMARELLDALLERFWDPDRLGVFNVDAAQRDVPVRQKELYDGATPSANATTWYVLLRLGRLTGDLELLDRAEALRRALAGPVAGAPSAHTMSLVALDLALGPAQEVVVTGDPDESGTRRMLAALAGRYAPRTAVLFKPAGSPSEAPGGPAADPLEEIAPFTAPYDLLDGKATAYVCADFACRRPTTDIAEMMRQLA